MIAPPCCHARQLMLVLQLLGVSSLDLGRSTGCGPFFARGNGGHAVSRPPSGHYSQGPPASPRSSSRCRTRSEEHTSELQSLMRNSYAVFCLKKKNKESKGLSNKSYRKPIK